MEIIDHNLRNHFVNLFSIALADNTIDPAEINFLYELGIEKGITQNQIDDIVANPHKARFIKPNTLIEAIEQLYDFAKMIIIDGKIHAQEVDLCKTFAKKFGVNETIVDELVEKLIDEVRRGIDKQTLINDVIKSI